MPLLANVDPINPNQLTCGWQGTYVGNRGDNVEPRQHNPTLQFNYNSRDRTIDITGVGHDDFGAFEIKLGVLKIHCKIENESNVNSKPILIPIQNQPASDESKSDTTTQKSDSKIEYDVSWKKSYLNDENIVSYQGTCTQNGLIKGAWNNTYDNGTFELTIFKDFENRFVHFAQKLHPTTTSRDSDSEIINKPNDPKPVVKHLELQSISVA